MGIRSEADEPALTQVQFEFLAASIGFDLQRYVASLGPACQCSDQASDDQQPAAHTSTWRPEEACSPSLRQAADQQRQLGLRKRQQRRRQLPA